jgi:GntR family transcriptional regulator, vanillate catabolism transcriptional regulator
MTIHRSAPAHPRDPRSQIDRVVLALRKMVLAGEFQPGERLAELTLVPLLKASRTPVRLALDRLAHEGLLEPLPTTGFRVRAFAVGDIYDAIEIRGVLEGMAARLAAERLQRDDDLRQLRRYYLDAAGLVPMTLEHFIRYIDLNEKFHGELWKLARSPMLLQEIERHVALPFAAPGALVFTEDSAASEADAVIALEHHRAIVEAIAQREGSRAEALAREHSHVARRALERALRSRELFRRMPGATLITTVERPGAERPEAVSST